jgi:hypothetical protein
MNRQDHTDIANADTHGFIPAAYDIIKEQQTFTITIFLWQLKRGGKSLKHSKGKVRVIAIPQDYDAAIERAKEIASALDSSTYCGPAKVYFVPRPKDFTENSVYNYIA